MDFLNECTQIYDINNNYFYFLKIINYMFYFLKTIIEFLLTRKNRVGLNRN